jgi:hypothetical protein
MRLSAGKIAIAFLALAGHTAASRAADDIAGSLIVFNDNGAWSWFEDERAIVDPLHGKIVVSSVANAAGPNGAKRAGDIDVVSYDLTARNKQRFTLSRRLQEDDHDSAALLILPDGRYLASYSKHASDNFLRYRVSMKPGDIGAWQLEQIFFTAGPTTYANLCYLSKPNVALNFHRDSGRGFDPNYVTWNLSTSTHFSYGGRLLTGPEGNFNHRDRPYLKYVSNGVDRVHFLATDHHPRNLVSNSVYHGYVECERDGYGVFRSDGTRLGELSSDSISPYKASNFTALLNGDRLSPINGLRMTRGWTTDIELDAAGNPFVIFTARVDDNDLDHRFFYGRFTPSGWRLHELARAGGHLYSPENDYTGLAALDPNDPDRVFISAKIDPRNQKTLARYEIFLGTTSDVGATWSWSPVTWDSTVDNIRPIAPRGAGDSTILLWLRGAYHSYTNYNTKIVGLTKIEPIDRLAFDSFK